MEDKKISLKIKFIFKDKLYTQLSYFRNKHSNFYIEFI
jgi:hypothetical protein